MMKPRSELRDTPATGLRRWWRDVVLVWRNPRPLLAVVSLVAIVAWGTALFAPSHADPVFRFERFWELDRVYLRPMPVVALFFAALGLCACPYRRIGLFGLASFGNLVWWLVPAFMYLRDGHSMQAIWCSTLVGVTMWVCYLWMVSYVPQLKRWWHGL